MNKDEREEQLREQIDAVVSPIMEKLEIDLSQKIDIALDKAFANGTCVEEGLESNEAAVVTPEELKEIRQRRAAMLFPGGRPSQPWLDIDRLLAHQEALRLAVNVRNQAIKKAITFRGDAATRMRDKCVQLLEEVALQLNAVADSAAVGPIMVCLIEKVESLTLDPTEEKNG